MRILLVFLTLLCSLQLSAQLSTLYSDMDPVDKNHFNLQINTSDGFQFTFERLLLQRGKYSLLGQAGISSALPSFGVNTESWKNNLVLPIGYSASLGIVNRFNLNEKHSLQLTAAVKRFQFYQPNKYQAIFGATPFDPLSKYVELEYRYEPMNSKLFITAGYRHSFIGNYNYGKFKFGVGLRF